MLKKILFDFDSYKRQYHSFSDSRGETILQLLKVTPETLLDLVGLVDEKRALALVDQYGLQDIKLPVGKLMRQFTSLGKSFDSDSEVDVKTALKTAVSYLKQLTLSRLALFIDLGIPYLREEDFVLSKKYIVRKSISSVFGKWPQTYGNAFFTDSRYLLKDAATMIEANLVEFLQRNKLLKAEHLARVRSAFETGRRVIQPGLIDSFAMNVMGHLDSRVQKYVYKRDKIENVLNRILRKVSLDFNVQNKTPIFSNMEDFFIVQYMLNNVLVTVIFFICLLSFILIFSLMQTDVEERKYEFAVLRTLGMRNRSLILLISLQTLLFALPAILLGFLATHALLKLSERGLNDLAHLEVRVEVQRRTVGLGLLTGLLIPFLSNVMPIR
mmetsp:Transcript_5577/g.9578  ORF Transcript_5577/g.9578 Transcript_5577/m.9578 type:complete len:384 (-) Transcript_5577:1867-3018(-)